ncbi:hypothetical protein HK096_009914 [Nowakowskiella sp. JEL0078]|nr:hypothetical protein HK096_009914 [Nowakowskiella sp. JEL0078]
MAFTTSFIPHTGNKYFISACEDGLALWDFEFGKVRSHSTLLACMFILYFEKILHNFEAIYSSYCDCAKFIECKNLQLPPEWWNQKPDTNEEVQEKKLNGKSSKSSTSRSSVSQEVDEREPMFAYLISRGVEVLDAEENTISL